MGRNRPAAIALSLVVIVCPSAIALNPSLDLNQYAHTAWRLSQGFSQGVTFSIAQTPDGYLWLGTEFGLRRFDGVQAVPWQPPEGEHLPDVQVRTLRVARDGRLWIGTLGGVASWKDGNLTPYPELNGYEIQALLEDREGTIWVGGWANAAGRLCRIQSGRTQCWGEDGRFGSGVTNLYEDSGGNLWVAGETGLWRWNPGRPKLYGMADPANLIFAVTESGDGGILIARHDGIIKLKNGRAEPYPLPPGLNMRPQRFFRDRDGGLWIGAAVDNGLLHVHDGRTDLFGPGDGLSGGSVSCIFEDREGTVWVSTGDGLDRFRDFAIPTFSVQQGLASNGIAAVLAASDGSLWVGTSHGLNRWNRGQITVYRHRSESAARGALAAGGFTAPTRALPGTTAREIVDTGLPEDFIATLFEDPAGNIWVGTGAGLSVFESGRFLRVGSIPRGIILSITADPAGNVWLSHRDGLFHLVRARVVESIPWTRLGREKPANALLYDAAQHGLWLGFADGGVGYFKDNQLHTLYGRAEGLGQGEVYGFSVDGNGALWAATEGGLSRIKEGSLLTLTSENGLPCNTVHWMMEDDAHSIWLNLACGLVRIARSELDAWASHPKQTIRATVFDSSDGVKSHRLHGGYNAIVTKSADGRIWFVPFGGLSVIDPRHLVFNSLPPPVHIEKIVADGKQYKLSSGTRLPPKVRTLAIDFVALSLAAPEKNRYRFRLDGWDSAWIDAVNEFRVEYTNLPPRNYRFRVIACNNSGVWNETGDTLEFSIDPAYYQTNLFYASCVAAFLAILWGLYRLRLYQIRREFHAQLDGRVDERLRVARDLHDTMLQTFQAALIQMQAGYNLLSRRPEKAAEAFQKAITTAAGAVAEGREAIQNMRSSPVETNDLARALRVAGDQMAAEGSARFDVRVQGSSRDLHPILRDDIYRIALEALRNAFQHAEAKAIEAEILYGDSLRVRVRDDGKGIDPAILKEGRRSGHFGLPGMRERAERVGGKLDVWSGAGAGTEIRLTIPGHIAFGKSRPGSLFRRFRRKSNSAAAAQS